jgi:hypothetical protein
MSIAVLGIGVFRFRILVFLHTKTSVLLWYMFGQKGRYRLACYPRCRRHTHSRVDIIVFIVTIVLCRRRTIIWMSIIQRHLDRHDGRVCGCMLQGEAREGFCTRV